MKRRRNGDHKKFEDLCKSIS